MASGVKCNDSVFARYNQLYKAKEKSFCVFKLNAAMNEIVPDEQVDTILGGQPNVDYKDLIKVVAEVSEGQPRYLLYDVKYNLPNNQGERRKILFILWCPDDTAKLKQKMVYAASKSEMKKLEGVSDDCQANEMCDLCEAVDAYIVDQQKKGR